MWVWVNSRSWWWTGRPGVLWFMGSQRVRHDWATELKSIWGFPDDSRGSVKHLQYRRCRFNSWVGKIPWRRKWQPTLLFLPEEFHGQRSLVGYSPWGCKELDTTEWLSTHTYIYNLKLTWYYKSTILQLKKKLCYFIVLVEGPGWDWGIPLAWHQPTSSAEGHTRPEREHWKWWWYKHGVQGLRAGENRKER